MNRKIFLLWAPFYGLGAVLGGGFAGLLSYGIYSDLHHGHTLLSTIFTILFFSQFFGSLFSVSRALTILEISEVELRIRNGLGFTRLLLDAMSKPGIIRIARKEDVFLEGPRVVEDSSLKKGAGAFIRWILFMTFSGYQPTPKWKTGLENFLIIIHDDTDPQKTTNHTLLPDVYSWNRAAYSLMNRWLQEKGYTVKTEINIVWDDPGVRTQGFILLAIAIGTTVTLLGTAIYSVF